MSRTMDNPNKVKAKLIVEVEAEFYDDESSEETLRYCVEQDLEDAGLNVIDVSVMEWGGINETAKYYMLQLWKIYFNRTRAGEHRQY